MKRSLILIFMTSFVLTAAFESSAEDPKANASVQPVLNAKHSTELKESVAKLVAKAPNKKLRAYKTHSHPTIALHAAWEEVKRSIYTKNYVISVKEETGEQDEDVVSDTRVNIDRLALQKFIGFVEGRLQITPPEWWQSKLGRAQVYSDATQLLWFAPRKRKTPYYRKYLDGIHILQELEFENLEEGGLNIQSEKFSCNISTRFLEEAKTAYGPTDGNYGPNSWRKHVGLTAWMDSEKCIFGFHTDNSSEFKLHCINRKSGKLIWSTEVWGYFYGGSTGSGFLNWVEMRRQGDTLVLFGLDSTGIAYIEGHSMKDGENLFHFSTSYVLDWEEDDSASPDSDGESK